MKALALILVGCGLWGNTPWVPADTRWEIASEMAIAVDWWQTSDLVRVPGDYEKSNPILGRHPSQKNINQWFAGWLIMHPLIMWSLPAPWRRSAQVMTVLVEAKCIKQNIDLGIALKF